MHLGLGYFSRLGINTYSAIPMSYAIIRTGGRQFKVEPGKKYRLPTLVGEPGGKIEFTDVLMGNDGKDVKGVDKKLAKAKVVGEIVRHGKGDKIVVFKMKRRKNYARKQGHRQGFTEVKINDISLG
jgi:large subunit ribosomal protein L21